MVNVTRAFMFEKLGKWATLISRSSEEIDTTLAMRTTCPYTAAAYRNTHAGTEKTAFVHGIQLVLP